MSDLDLAKFSLADAVMAIGTLAAAIAALYYIRQNNQTLKELKKQNEIAANPVLQLRLVEQPDASRTLDIDECGPDCVQSFVAVTEDWKNWLTNLGLAGVAESSAVFLEIENAGAGKIVSLHFRAKVSVEHHAETIRQVGPAQSTASYMKVVECMLTVGVNANEGSVAVRLVDTGFFPIARIDIQAVSYSDARGQTHYFEGEPYLKVHNERLIYQPQQQAGPGEELEIEDLQPYERGAEPSDYDPYEHS